MNCLTTLFAAQAVQCSGMRRLMDNELETLQKKAVADLNTVTENNISSMLL
jgi:hypothetical protein